MPFLVIIERFSVDIMNVKCNGIRNKPQGLGVKPYVVSVTTIGDYLEGTLVIELD